MCTFIGRYRGYIIPCSFDFDLKKKIRPLAPSQKVVEDNQTIIFLGLTDLFETWA